MTVLNKWFIHKTNTGTKKRSSPHIGEVQTRDCIEAPNDIPYKCGTGRGHLHNLLQTSNWWGNNRWSPVSYQGVESRYDPYILHDGPRPGRDQHHEVLSGVIFGEHKYVYNRATEHLSPIPIVSHPILQTVLFIVNIKLSANFNSIFQSISIKAPLSSNLITRMIGATRSLDF